MIHAALLLALAARPCVEVPGPRVTAGDIPAGYLDGVTEVVVSPRAVPHPTRADISKRGRSDR